MSRTQAAFCATFVDELILNGVTNAVICPGSRSTPLVLAVAESSMAIHVRLDERSAGFFAIGVARATSTPVLVVVTSGTAVAELHAAVVEAHLDHVPLIIATADRPGELHEIGAPQTFRQRGIFADHVSFAVDPGPCHAFPRGDWRSLASRLAVEAMGISGIPGPVHVNLAFSEPLLAKPDEIPEPRRAGRPCFSMSGGAHLEALEARSGAPRVVVVAGNGVADPVGFLDAARRVGWPVLADPRSGCRLSNPLVVAAADGILRDASAASLLTPDVVVVAGAPPASKVVTEWLQRCADEGTEIVALGLDGPARFPFRTEARFLIASVDEGLRALADAWAPAPSEWAERWAQAERAAQAAIDSVLDREQLTEPGVARILSRSAPSGTSVVVSSSMPIRDLEWFGSARPDVLRVHANRGANGIDGVVSTAMGVASAGGGVVALVGDLAFFHDVSALVDGIEDDASLLIVVIDNDGGGIFSFLPQRDALDSDRFERLFGTPRRPSVAEVVHGFRVPVTTVSTKEALGDALDAQVGVPGLRVVVVDAPSRDENVSVHAEINAVVARAVRERLVQR